MGTLINGIDVSALPPQFEGAVAGRTLIIDGDGPAYRAAATSKRIGTAISRFQTEVLTQLFITKAEFATVHFTSFDSKKNGRFNIIAEKPYQGNRSGKEKPPLLEVLREQMCLEAHWLPEFTCVMNRVLEADDAMIQQAYQLKEDGIIWSDDKDLRMTPFPYYDMKRCEVLPSAGFGSIWLDNSTITTKCLGHGLKFFWAQMLMGDTADNIKGVRKLHGKLCGPAAACAELKDLNEADTVNAVIDAYRAEDQNPIPEGWLLWLLRHPGDTFYQYLIEHWGVLTDANKLFLAACAGRVWFKKEEPKDEPEIDVPW